MECTLCHLNNQQWYIHHEDDLICNECFKLYKISKKKISQEGQPQFFTQWHCETHKCGSYKSKQFDRHYMLNCIITTTDTEGYVTPKTYGGCNGDLHRKYFNQLKPEIDIIEERWIKKIKNIHKSWRRTK